MVNATYDITETDDASTMKPLRGIKKGEKFEMVNLHLVVLVGNTLE